MTSDIYDTPGDASMLGVNNMLVANSDMDAEKVYKITKAIYDRMDEFRANNAHARQIVPERSRTLKIPLHPGAARYFNQ
jgi:TRAP-type uncharacterized transport system substrate-binding protein